MAAQLGCSVPTGGEPTAEGAPEAEATGTSASELRSICAGDFVLSANGYTFNLHLEGSNGHASGSLDQTAGPWWGFPYSAVDATCTGDRIVLTRYLNNGYQQFTGFGGANGWTGTFTTPNSTARDPFTITRR